MQAFDELQGDAPLAPGPAARAPHVRGVGLVGLGSIGRVHAEVLQRPGALPFTLVAGVDPSPGAWAEQLRVVSDIDSLLEDPGVQVVVIATPPDTHAPLAATALSAGKHVLLEKPPALSLQDLDGVRHLARERGLVAHAALHARFGPAVRRAASLLAPNRIVQFEIVYREDVTKYHRPGSWVFDRERSGGGVLIDSGINALSVLTALVEPRSHSVHVASMTDPSRLGVETRALVELSVGSARGRLDMDWLHEGRELRSFTLLLDDGGHVELDLVQQSLTVNGDAVLRGDAERALVDQHEEYAGVYRHFATVLQEDRADLAELELAIVQEVYGYEERAPSGGLV